MSRDFGCLSTLSCSEAHVNRSGIFLIYCHSMRLGASCSCCVCSRLISMLALLSSQEYRCLMPAQLDLGQDYLKPEIWTSIILCCVIPT